MDYIGQDAHFPMHGTADYDYWGYYNNKGGHIQYEDNIRGKYDRDFVQLAYWCFWNPLNPSNNDVYYTVPYGAPVDVGSSYPLVPNWNSAKIGMLSKLTYPTGGHTAYEYEPHRFGKYITRDNEQKPELVNFIRSNGHESIAGGGRIKSITDVSDHTIETKFYTYSNIENNESTGHLLNNPNGGRVYYTARDIDDEETPKDGFHPITGLYALERQIPGYISTLAFYSEGYHIEYEKVREIHDDGSSIEYEFSNYRTNPDRFSISATGAKSDNISGEKITPDAGIGIFTNLHISGLWWEKWFGVVRDFTQERKEIRRRIRNSLIQPDWEPSFRGKLLSVSNYGQSGTLLRRKYYIYDTSKERDYLEFADHAADLYYVRRSYLESYPLVGVRTHEFSSETGVDPVTTEYSYEYNALGQMKKTSWIESDGSVVSKEAVYVSDLEENERTGVFRTMIEKHVLDPIIALKEYLTTASSSNSPQFIGLIKGEKFEYKDVGAPSQPVIRPSKHLVSKYGQSQPTIFDAPVEYYTDTTYDRYDTNGRLLETTDRMGIKTAYVWGYDGLYVVAKVVGASFETVKTAVGLRNDNYLNTEAEIETAGAVLRRLPGVQVTSWLYDPHVGVTKVIDPRGIDGDGHQLRVGEVAVIGGVLLAAHGERLPRAVVPAPRLLAEGT